MFAVVYTLISAAACLFDICCLILAVYCLIVWTISAGDSECDGEEYKCFTPGVESGTRGWTCGGCRLCLLCLLVCVVLGLSDLFYFA